MVFCKSVKWISLLLLLLGCDTPVTNPIPELKFTYYTLRHREVSKGSEFSMIEIKHHELKDSLLATRYFTFNQKHHTIRMYTTDYSGVPIDGGESYYELDSLGIIYTLGTSWYAYQRLKSNNDSLNLIIDTALDNIILYPELHCYHCETTLNKRIK